MHKLVSNSEFDCACPFYFRDFVNDWRNKAKAVFLSTR
jgi:hypothetical protein